MYFYIVLEKTEKNEIMRHLLRYFLICAFAVSLPLSVSSQTTGTHEVKKKETMYSISKMYGITVEELVQANPGMEKPDYKLKKGSVIVIPLRQQEAQQVSAALTVVEKCDVRNRAIRLGIMLPLHKINNDGKRMVEY